MNESPWSRGPHTRGITHSKALRVGRGPLFLTPTRVAQLSPQTGPEDTSPSLGSVTSLLINLFPIKLMRDRKFPIGKHHLISYLTHVGIHPKENNFVV